MELNRRKIKQTMTISKTKIWLCILGIIICMSILAAVPPLSQNTSAGSQPAAPVHPSMIKRSNQAAAGTRSYVFQSAFSFSQSASQAGQGSDSAVQGPASAAAADTSAQDTPPEPANPDSDPPISIEPCRGYMQPLTDKCGGPICAQVYGSSCDRCSSQLRYACLIE